MSMDPAFAAVAFELTRLHRRTVTSFYSNLVTRPTGRAVRMGLEGQLREMDGQGARSLSVLDFSQVLVLDYSCADEIVAKLLLRYIESDRPADAYFVARGLQDHHREAIEAVLEHRELRMVAHEAGRAPELLGPADPVERACWATLVTMGRAAPEAVADRTGLPGTTVRRTIERFHELRVTLRVGEPDLFTPLAAPQGSNPAQT